MIGKMKKKVSKVHIVDMKYTDVEMVDTEKDKKVTKPLKRGMESDDSAVPMKKIAKTDKKVDHTQKDDETPNQEKTEVKTHKQESEEARVKKRLRKMREKKFYEVREEVKKLWEDLRKVDLESKKRVRVTSEMFKLVEGKVVHLVFAHDTSRCVQSLVKFGTASQKDAIFKELKGSFPKMMKSKFGKFCVRKFLKYGSKKHRQEIFTVLKGNIAVLLRHKEASDIVEMAYNDYANSQQRSAMEEEFYGPTYLINKTGEIKNLTGFKKKFPDKMPVVVHYMKDKLFSLVEKSILQLSMVHKLLYDFFEVADAASRGELIESLKDHVPHLVHTRNGSRVAMRCLWFGSAKDRKSVVKGLRTYVLKVSQEEQGHLFMMALFDCVDDTRLVTKAVLDEFLKSLDQVVENQFSRKVLLYLLSPRNAMFFHPDVIKILLVGDDNPHSKKSSEMRRGELLSYISAPLLQWTSSHISTLTSDNNLMLLLLAIINNATGDTSELMKQVSQMVAEPFPATGFHFIDDSSGHLVLKKMIGSQAIAMQARVGHKEDGGVVKDEGGVVKDEGGVVKDEGGVVKDEDDGGKDEGGVVKDEDDGGKDEDDGGKDEDDGGDGGDGDGGDGDGDGGDDGDGDGDGGDGDVDGGDGDGGDGDGGDGDDGDGDGGDGDGGDGDGDGGDGDGDGGDGDDDDGDGGDGDDDDGDGGDGDDGDDDDGDGGDGDDDDGDGGDGDTKKMQKGKDSKPENAKISFAEVLIGQVSGDNMRSWLHCNRGCFILVLLLELKNSTVTVKIHEALLNCKSTLKKIDSKGAQILLKKLP